MAKGWVVFRDPRHGRIVAWSGDFKSVDAYLHSTEPAFYVQPWQTGSPLEVLVNIEPVADWRSWLAEHQLKRSLTDSSDASRAEFTRLVSFIITGIHQGDFEKVVPSRSQTIITSAFNLPSVFEQACTDYPAAFVSVLFHPDYGTWFGATPEQFLHWEENRASVQAVAGTRFREGQYFTDKETLEHSVIEKYLREVLRKRNVSFESSETQSLSQGTITHLASVFQFSLNQNQLDEWLMMLHPTPAVGGYPQREAISFISRFEHLDRKLFAGWLGWRQNGTFRSWVNIRCAELGTHEVKLFAGCGVNVDSDPETEWLETEAKMQVIGKYFTEAP